MNAQIEYARPVAWKYAVDYGIGIPLTIICLPLMIVVFVLVRIFIGTPVIFRQDRPGLYGRIFTLYKFRTMTNARNAHGELLSDAERLTTLGRFLRSTSLDELPELLNVLKGEMSLVGPRPLLVKYLPYYTERELLRHTVKPGITGWAQINGRNDVPWDDRLAMDVWYVENRRPALDVLIMAKTLLKVLFREGASADADLAESNLDEERTRRMA
jgi:lipopolysaccharide/colanic/teichoic acid biosynthesis glycosyltransferase